MCEVDQIAEVRVRLQHMGQDQFEDFVGEFWEAQGWETEVTQRSNDMGLDVDAWKRTDVVNQKASIQAKRYSETNKVDRPEVQQYFSLRHQDPDSDMSVVITTSSFTGPAYEWAEDMNVKLLDGDMLAQWLVQRDLVNLIDGLAPEFGEIDDDGSERHVSWEEREAYYSTWPLESMLGSPSESEIEGLLEQLGTHRRAIGRIEAIHSLLEHRQAGDVDSNSIVENLSENTWLVEPSWYYTDRLEGLEEDLKEELGVDFSEDSCFEDILCVQFNEERSILCICNPQSTAAREELNEIESFIDEVRFLEGLETSQLHGFVIGGDRDRSRRTQQKLNRLRRDGIKIKTYDQLLETAVETNKTLFQLIRRPARIHGNHSVIEKLEAINNAF